MEEVMTTRASLPCENQMLVELRCRVRSKVLRDLAGKTV